MEKFLLVGLKANLPAERDTNKLYFCSDTRELYKGMDLYTEAVRVVSTIPEQPATGVLYILPTGEVKSFTGTETITVAKPYVTSGTLSETSTVDEVPTAKVVYDSIVEAISVATGGGDAINTIVSTKAGTITVTSGENEEDVAITGTVVNPSYDALTRTIRLPYMDSSAEGGKTTLEITLGKDIFIDSAADNKYNPETGNIELYLNDASGETPSTKIEIPASGLIDVYTGGDTNTVTVEVSDSNVITANVHIANVENNRLSIHLVEENKGLLVDVSDLEDAIDTLNGDSKTEGSVAKAVADAEARVKVTTDSLQESIDTLNGNDTTEGSVAKALKDAKDYTDSVLAWGTF